MSDKNAEPVAEGPEDALPHPRFGWLAVFQLIIISLVVLMAHETRGLSQPAMLEEQLGPLSESPTAIAPGPWAGRGWLAALVAMVGALLLMLPVAWAYVATRMRKQMDASVVTTIVLLPIAVAAILVIVQDSLAVAFSLAGIAGLVRFRNALDDTRDAMYVVIAIAVGLGAGVGTLEASAALSGIYTLAVVALWKWSTSRPVIADIALGERVPKGQTVLQALTQDGGRHPEPAAEWFEPGKTVPLAQETPIKLPDPAKREGILRVHAADDIPTRRVIEEVLDAHTKRWSLETDDPGPDNLPTLTYCVRLKKRTPPEALLEMLRQRLGPELTEYTPTPSAGNGTSQPGR
ncbi:MAG: DUF4956 domain-containing protein [Gemmatimonadales bacterium]|nr:DUF4956 domain-containing protein [Gemmatimonadales bacterium]